MKSFNGILNDNGIETKIRICLNLYAQEPYTTDLFIDNEHFDAKIDGNICTIMLKKVYNGGMCSFFDFIFDEETEEVRYELCAKNFSNETILMGREIRNNYFPCISFFMKPKFFVATNKEGV